MTYCRQISRVSPSFFQGHFPTGSEWTILGFFQFSRMCGNPGFSSILVSSNPLSSKPTSSGISDQLRDIYMYSICRCCWNVATYKWKVHNGKMEIISVVVVVYGWWQYLTISLDQMNWNYMEEGLTSTSRPLALATFKIPWPVDQWTFFCQRTISVHDQTNKNTS